MCFFLLCMRKWKNEGGKKSMLTCSNNYPPNQIAHSLSPSASRHFNLNFILCFHIECAAICAQIFALHETKAQRIKTEPCWNA